MKVLKSLITVMLGASILFTVGCNNNSNVQDDYDIATRIPLDKNEITYTVPERDTYYNFIEVYDDYLIIKARDILTKKWISQAQFVIYLY